MSRELGGALGIATIGSVVSSLYRSNVGDALVGLPPEVADLAGESVGVAALTASQLPAEVGAEVLVAANGAFMDAMTTGFQISAAILLTAVVIAFTLIPKRMRTSQALAGDGVDLTEFTPEKVPEGAVA